MNIRHFKTKSHQVNGQKIMKNQTSQFKHPRTLTGATAIYIVIFTTIILSVISVSFVRIMNSGVNNMTNSDLSASAYDSALAGIEDAKIALVKYHECIDKNNSQDGTCNELIEAMETGMADDSCDTVANALGRSDSGSVTIQESTVDSLYMDQAYTCVKISEELDDYRGTLDSSKRTLVIPLRTANPEEVEAIKIMWHSQDDNVGAMGSEFPNKSAAANKIPPLTVDIFQTDSSFIIGELSTKKDDNLNHVQLVLRASSLNGTEFNARVVEKDNTITLANKHNNNPIDVPCSNTDFMCGAIINLPLPIQDRDSSTTRAKGTFFLRIALPYANEAGTDFSITMCTEQDCKARTGYPDSLANGLTAGDGTAIAKFSGIQALIDSTGRANDIYRRVETRVELVDLGFPYPEFEVWMAGGDASTITKSFWVTNDCKTRNSDSTGLTSCSNAGNL